MTLPHQLTAETEGPGWEVSGIKAALSSCDLDKAGNLTLTFSVAPDSKYAALPITDIKGRMYSLDISTASKRVFAGKEGIEEARKRVADRRAERNGTGRGGVPSFPLDGTLAADDD